MDLISYYPNNSEKTAQSYFEALGFTVLNLEPGDTSNNIIRQNKDFDGREVNAIVRILGDHLDSGVPDLFCYKKHEGLTSIEITTKFFVEVKSSNDSLRLSQVNYIANSEVETKLMHVEQDEYQIYDLEISNYATKSKEKEVKA